MSGPTTAILIEDPVAVLMSAAGIRAAMAIQQGYQQGAELASTHKADRDNVTQQQQAANQQGAESIRQQISQAETELNQLLTLSQRIGAGDRIESGRPRLDSASLSNASVSPAELAVYLATLKNYNADVKSILLTRAASQISLESWDEGFDIAPVAPPEFDALTKAEVASDSELVQQVNRIMARIAHLEEIPETIHKLTKELAKDLPHDRKELLLNELRREIQIALEKHQQQQVQQASALILRQSLKDLGYQVEEFSDTLFIEGGIAHFRRHEWGDYMVRLRINEKTHTINFNVIRSVRNASNERTVLDHLAEDRWCAEFPALLKAMEARGLGLNVTRRLEAGELPVQLVNVDQLPQFAEEETRISSQPLKARELD